MSEPWISDEAKLHLQYARIGIEELEDLVEKNPDDVVERIVAVVSSLCTAVQELAVDPEEWLADRLQSHSTQEDE